MSKFDFHGKQIFFPQKYMADIQLVTMDLHCCRMCMVAFPHFIMVSKNYTQSRDPPDERICIFRKANSVNCVEIKRNKNAQINSYFGNAYVAKIFFWCKNMTCNNACNTDKITLLFVIYDL